MKAISSTCTSMQRFYFHLLSQLLVSQPTSSYIATDLSNNNFLSSWKHLIEEEFLLVCSQNLGSKKNIHDLWFKWFHNKLLLEIGTYYMFSKNVCCLLFQVQS